MSHQTEAPPAPRPPPPPPTRTFQYWQDFRNAAGPHESQSDLPDTSLYGNTQIEHLADGRGSFAESQPRRGKFDFENIFRIDREGVLEGEATRGIERQVIADSLISRNFGPPFEAARTSLTGAKTSIWGFTFVSPTARRATSAADSHITLDQDRRQRKHVADIIEPVTAVIGRERVAGFDVKSEQIADGIAVFAAIQAMDRWVPGLGWAAAARSSSVSR